MGRWRLTRRHITGLGVSIAAVAALVGALSPFREDIGLLNAALLFLLLSLIVSAVWGRGVGIFAAVLANLAFNLFFIEPLHTFTVQEPHNALALIVFLLVSVIGGTLLDMAKRGTEQAHLLQAESQVALRLSHAMAGQTEPQAALQALCREIADALRAPAVAVLIHNHGAWSVVASAGEADDAARLPDTEERAAADRSVSTRTQQGIGRSGLDGARTPRIVVPEGRQGVFASRDRSTAFAPLSLGERVLGVLRLDGPIGDSPFRNEPRRLLEAAASEAALALERVDLARAAAHAEALREADELKTTLLTAISHDMKTPVATIKAAISVILDQNITWSAEDLATFYQTIDSQADRLNRVISDILDLSRVESGAVTPDQSVVRPMDLLRQARDLTAQEAGERVLSVEGSEELRAVVDEALIIQALVNLIENSIKYSRPGGGIHLIAVAEEGHALLTVEDDGPGIPEKDLPHIFDRFYRAASPNGEVKGSGLGLTIVKSFVELCDGSVSVTSSAEGTRFTLSLPMPQPAEIRR